MPLEAIKKLLDTASTEDRAHVLQLIRQRYQIPIHHLETDWNTTAEAVLEAISHSQDITQRGIRGLLAEAIFRTTVLPQSLPHWKNIEFDGDLPYDFLLDDGQGPLRVQVKLQRKERGAVKYHRGDQTLFVVETQRTRSGKRRENQEASRPYRVNEFDVLAVCLHPATHDWTSFIFCGSCDLRIRPKNPELLEVMQPIPVAGSAAWSREFDHVANRVRAHRSQPQGPLPTLPLSP